MRVWMCALVLSMTTIMPTVSERTTMVRLWRVPRQCACLDNSTVATLHSGQAAPVPYTGGIEHTCTPATMAFGAGMGGIGGISSALGVGVAGVAECMAGA